jgi:hypothetical protein
LLIRGLNEWSGSARCSRPLAEAMGFGDLELFLKETERLMSGLEKQSPLPPGDWRRALVATEIVFASYVLGAPGDWPITTGLPDAETWPLRRGLQLKLQRSLATRGAAIPGS